MPAELKKGVPDNFKPKTNREVGSSVVKERLPYRKRKEFYETRRPYREAAGEIDIKLEMHDRRVQQVYDAVAVQGLDLRYHERPKNPEQQIQNQLIEIRALAGDMLVPANSQLGESKSSSSKQNPRLSVQEARQHLITVITKGNVEPSSGVRTKPEVETHIDRYGNLINPTEKQAFCAPLKDVGLFKSPRDSGPYFVILEDTATATDRTTGIKDHKAYIVPGEEDRKVILRQLGENVDPGTLNKIVTYDEFLQAQKTTKGAERKIATARRIEGAKDKVRDMRRQVIALSQQKEKSWEDAADLYSTVVSDPTADVAYRGLLAYDIRNVSEAFPDSVTVEDVLGRVKDQYMQVVTDEAMPEGLRTYCLRAFEGHEKVLSPEDKGAVLYIMRDNTQGDDIRRTAIDVVSGYRESEINETLVDMAQDKKLSAGVRHNALFRLKGAGERVINTFVDYIKSDNEQGQKIAMYKLLNTPLVEPESKIFDAVRALYKKNQRGDVSNYIKEIFRKFFIK